jgi:predicted dithiol-disulfide oxidoreductase (DUF899 family)
MTQHEITGREEWLLRRRELLAREKAFTQLKDELAAARRALPWVRIDKQYWFEGSRGRVSLSELFRGRSQLIVYHFMFGPSAEVGCKSCSFWADNFDGVLSHLGARDVTLAAVSRAPLAKLRAFQQRMGWSFEWVSAGASDFAFDLGVSFREDERAQGSSVYNYAPLAQGPFAKAPNDLHGVSVFAKDEAGALFHTYSTYGRGLDILNGAYQYLDLVPKGRDEATSNNWLRFHDEYPRSA